MDIFTIILFISTLNCTDYNSEDWNSFHYGMMQEWNVTTSIGCYAVDRPPDNMTEVYELREYLGMQKGIHQLVLVTDYNRDIFHGTLTRGISVPTTDIAIIQKNMTGCGAPERCYDRMYQTTSHEILHLYLEEIGHTKRCYSSFVHMYRDDIIQYGEIPILAHFNCRADE